MLKNNKESNKKTRLIIHTSDIGKYQKVRSLPAIKKVDVTKFLIDLNDSYFEKDRNAKLSVVNKKNKSSIPFFFIHIPRCGGNFINEIFNENNIENIKVFNCEDKESSGHHSLFVKCDASMSHGMINDSIFTDSQIDYILSLNTLTIVRNPADWLYSMYYFGSSKDMNDIKNINCIYGVGNIRRYIKTFNDFLEYFLSNDQEDIIPSFKYYRENPFFQIYDSDGNVFVKNIVKLEEVENIYKILDVEAKSKKKVNEMQSVFNMNKSEILTKSIRKKIYDRYKFLYKDLNYEE